MSEIAVRVEHLSKKYRLGVINNGTLFRDIQTWIAIKRGKDDPHSRIGENKYNNTEDFFWALKDIGFDIKQGDRVGIIGKNGAGKSTLLKILSRITAPTEGKIKIKGKIASLLEVGTGFHGELTGRENIYLNGAILGMKKRRIDEKINDIIEFCGIEHHIDTPVKRYSNGMYVRLAFAVAAHLDSDILIADEVLAVGDAEFQKKALGKMQNLSTGEGRTVLFVSHNMSSVKRLCNFGILLNKGKIITSGKIVDVIDSYLEKKEDVSKILRNEQNKLVYLSSLFTCDVSGLEKSTFTFSEDIHFRICIKTKEITPDVFISLSLLSDDKIRIFTEHKIIENKTKQLEIIVDFKIKGSFFAPSEYSFMIYIYDVSLNELFDSYDDICTIKILDNGTKFYRWNGKHYGYFIIQDQCEWERIL